MFCGWCMGQGISINNESNRNLKVTGWDTESKDYQLPGWLKDVHAAGLLPLLCSSVWWDS